MDVFKENFQIWLYLFYIIFLIKMQVGLLQAIIVKNSKFPSSALNSKNTTLSEV